MLLDPGVELAVKRLDGAEVELLDEKLAADGAKEALDLAFGRAVADGRVKTLVAEASGTTFSAQVWIDASYEGDLLAAAGVNMTWGREAAAPPVWPSSAAI